MLPVGLDRIVVSTMHCGCINLGSIPSLDMPKFFLRREGSLMFYFFPKCITFHTPTLEAL